MVKDINSIQYYGKLTRINHHSGMTLLYLTNNKLYNGEIECFINEDKKHLLDNIPDGTMCVANGKVVMVYSPLKKAYGEGRIIQTTERNMVPTLQIENIWKANSERDLRCHFHISGIIREKIIVRKTKFGEDSVFNLYCTKREDRKAQCLRIFSPNHTTNVLKHAEAGSYIYCVCEIRKSIYKDSTNKKYRRMMNSVYLRDVEIIRNGSPSVF